ncbi:hypothetical protein GCM10023210_32300 [Chryseobacterium ginsengisoli]|uniref:Uncharacterized protein n=1 Tax=Chryseobacterium ginsengisoli TaxID=363853 RepID=A0ABP9MIR3_9FLAO
MGDLHCVYQLKPKVLTNGTILRVKKDQENIFLEKYKISKNFHNKGQEISPNIFIINSNDGKVRRYALYATARIINFEESGVYVSIQDGRKSGFIDFEESMAEISPYLENALFYVVVGTSISKYEIKDEQLLFERTLDSKFDSWDYNFGKYLSRNYTSDKQLIADFYTEDTNELILYHNELIEDGCNPKEYYDKEEYEEQLAIINNYKQYISIEKFKELEDWLKIQINYYQ